jgi:hypothetical protein
MKAARSFRAAAILETVRAPAELRAFGRVDAPEVNMRAVNFQCVAVDNAGLAGQIAGQRRTG